MVASGSIASSGLHLICLCHLALAASSMLGKNADWHAVWPDCTDVGPCRHGLLCRAG